MSNLPVLSPAEARGPASEALDAAGQAFGFVPNLIGVMANAPALAKAYLAVGRLFDQTSLSPTERQIVLLAVSGFNHCTYCMAAHTTVARMQKVPEDVVEALRTGQPINDERRETLRRFAVHLVDKRGWPDEDHLAAFLEAGYTHQQVLEVVLGIGMKTLSNYTNHIADTPLDDAFAASAWTADD